MGNASHSNFLVFRDNDENKAIINIYVAIIKQIEDEIFSYIDEFEDKDFIFGGDTARFKFSI